MPATRRSPVQRTNAWHNNFYKPARCREGPEMVIAREVYHELAEAPSAALSGLHQGSTPAGYADVVLQFSMHDCDDILGHEVSA